MGGQLCVSSLMQLLDSETEFGPVFRGDGIGGTEIEQGFLLDLDAEALALDEAEGVVSGPVLSGSGL